MSETFARLMVEDGNEVEATRDNTSIYKHLGKAALYDHVFVSLGENAGSYVWKHHSSHAELEALAEEHNCVTHSNLPDASNFDKEQYEKQVLEDMADTFPEEWEVME